MVFRLVSLLALLSTPLAANAAWTIMDDVDPDSSYKTRLAQTINSNSYTLEIYRDRTNAIRTRFSLPQTLLQLAPKTCPTFQIDRGQPHNRSINDAPCISNTHWVEFIFGYASSNTVTSSTLLDMMNGNSIIFRFKLRNGDYRETSFSLTGSKEALTEAIGQNVTVIASP